jgi:hypothetical protein
MKLFATIGVVAVLLSPAVTAWAPRAHDPSSQPASAQTPPPDQSLPATEPRVEPAPPSQQAPEQSPPQTQTRTLPQPSPDEKPKPAAKAAVKKRRARAKKPVGSQTGKVVVKNGGARDVSGQISPGMSDEQAMHQRETTSQLLATTDANLKKVAGRQLNPAQQSMLDQIHTYVGQAKTAADSGDVTRARTLAFKAHLLSDELARK